MLGEHELDKTPDRRLGVVKRRVGIAHIINQ
jgi:hypothetical protein